MEAVAKEVDFPLLHRLYAFAIIRAVCLRRQELTARGEVFVRVLALATRVPYGTLLGHWQLLLSSMLEMSTPEISIKFADDLPDDAVSDVDPVLSEDYRYNN